MCPESEPCHSPATAEDLLCDNCRRLRGAGDLLLVGKLSRPTLAGQPADLVERWVHVHGSRIEFDAGP